MNLEPIIQSEVSQKEKNKYHILTHIYGISKNGSEEFIYRAAMGEGNGNPLQYSCLENPVDRGAWWAAVHGVSKSRTRLKRLSSSSSSSNGETYIENRLMDMGRG